MNPSYPTYTYTSEDAQLELARFVALDNPESYPFDNFHAHEYNEILVFINGGGCHNVNFKNHFIEHHSIHLLAANDLHWVERSMKSTGFAIVYKEQFLQKLQIVNPNFDFCSLFNFSRIINLNEQEAKDFEFIFREILHNKTQSAYMLQLIGVFISKIANLSYTEPTTKKIFDPIVPELIKLIEKNFKSQKTISFYANKLNLTPRTLQNRFKKASSISITELIQERVLKEAKKLLCTSSMSIRDIADELGFKEPAHFTNWFKKSAKCLPIEYKYEND
ncbi:MAG: AraC family transcriptional regulator [Bacteroidetes bacterium]|nr:AraC family transcriptional regulator [Bacteroidota bacterium]MBS1740163.1 AraC family transcriptional regulator [Bacteroidota bacterium]MBS1776796.1 AraC family transcriptional regulator [Bacteroidota bacterium]